MLRLRREGGGGAKEGRGGGRVDRGSAKGYIMKINGIIVKNRPRLEEQHMDRDRQIDIIDQDGSMNR